MDHVVAVPICVQWTPSRRMLVVVASWLRCALRVCGGWVAPLLAPWHAAEEVPT